MKIIIILLAGVFLLTSCSQEPQYSISETYENGHKKTIEVTQGDRLIKKVHYSETGDKKSVEIYDQQNLVSRWTAGNMNFSTEAFTEYFGNGVLKKSGHYIDEKMNGKWSYYNRHNHLETERYFFNDEPTGIWVWYDEHKHVHHIEDHGDIKSKGQFIEYYLSGQVKQASFYNNGNYWRYNVHYYRSSYRF